MAELEGRIVSPPPRDPRAWHQVAITIPSTSKAKTRDSKAAVFFEVAVDGAAYGRFRYSQLKVLHCALAKEFGEARLAPFPTKENVELRRAGLEAYLQHVCATQELATYPRFVSFMRIDSLAKGLKEPAFGLDAPWWVAGLAVVNPIASAHMIWSSLRGKINRVGDILDGVAFPPESKLLDVGCGHGLMTIQAQSSMASHDHPGAAAQHGVARGVCCALC